MKNGYAKWSTNSSDHIADIIGNKPLNDNSWHLLTTTYDSSSGKSALYVDGLLDVSSTSHLVGSLLGSGTMPQGKIGKGTGSASRQTIFSTGFETPDEKTKWQEHNSTGGQQQTWATLAYDNFNTGWGSYTDGDGSGSDCYRTSSYKHEGTYSVCLRDNSGTYSSFYLTNGIDLDTPAYKSMKIDFWWMWNGIGWSNGEDWFLNYYDGSVWRRILDIDYPSGLSQDVWYHKIVYINETSYNFPTNMKIQFQCDASDDNDRVYFDQIYINTTTWGRIESDFDQLPSTALLPHTGSYSIGGSGDFDPEYAAYNRTRIDLTNFTNVELSVWYSYKNTDTNDFIGLYYLNSTHWTPIFEVAHPVSGSGQIAWVNVHMNLPTFIHSLVLQFKWRTSSTTKFVAIDDLEITGIPHTGEANFTGIIDEVKIYQRVLSAEQIYQNYLCSKNGRSDCSVLVAEEMLANEHWYCLVTPNNGIVDDIPTYSNILAIKGVYSGG